MNSSIKVLNTLIIAALLVVIAFFGFRKVETYLRNKAIDDCGKNSRYEYTNPDNTVKTSTPNEEAYIRCLSDKGIKISVEE